MYESNPVKEEQSATEAEGENFPAPPLPGYSFNGLAQQPSPTNNGPSTTTNENVGTNNYSNNPMAYGGMNNMPNIGFNPAYAQGFFPNMQQGFYPGGMPFSDPGLAAFQQYGMNMHPAQLQYLMQNNMGPLMQPGMTDTTADGRKRFLSPDLDQADPRSTKTIKRTPRPLDMPRHPLNAYNFFFSDERECIVRTLNDLTAEEIAKLDLETHDCSKEEDDTVKWPTLDAEGKEELLTAHIKRREEQKKKRRPHRKSHGKISFKDLATVIAKRWKTLSPERLSFYHALADKDLNMYRKAMVEYKQNICEFKG
jgi:hypothetical protein